MAVAQARCDRERMGIVYFDERIAQRYETYWPHLFEPTAIEPVVGFLTSQALNAL